MTNILNLTQHVTTSDQFQSDVVDLKKRDAKRLRVLLTFHSLPSRENMEYRAEQIALIAKGYRSKTAMIGGAPFFMSILERELMKAGINVVYAFSKRQTISETSENGKVTKRNVFKHMGFVRVPKAEVSK